MVKKIVLLVSALFLFFSLQYTFSASANCSLEWDISSAVERCVDGTWLYVASDWKIEGGMRQVVLSWVKNISLYIWIFAVFAIVFAAFMLVISTGNDEKINKAKDIFKWAVLWLVWVMFAGTLITVLVNTFYGILK